MIHGLCLSDWEKINENEKIVSLDKKEEIELNDEINNARKKRRRSSANIE